MKPYGRPRSKLQQPTAGTHLIHRRGRRPIPPYSKDDEDHEDHEDHEDREDHEDHEDHEGLLGKHHDHQEEQTVSTQEDDASSSQQERQELGGTTADLETRCATLQESLRSLRRQHTSMKQTQLEDEQARAKEDEEIVSTMRLMKEYIDQLETDDDQLTKTCELQLSQIRLLGEQHDSQGDTSSVNSVQTSPEMTTFSPTSKNDGFGWKSIALMARTLAHVQKENAQLQDALVSKSRQLKSTTEANERLLSKVEEMQDDQDRLSVKYHSLEEAAHIIVKESEGSSSKASGSQASKLLLEKEEARKPVEANTDEVSECALHSSENKATNKSLSCRISEEATALSGTAKRHVPTIVVETVDQDSDDELTVEAEVVDSAGTAKKRTTLEEKNEERKKTTRKVDADGNGSDNDNDSECDEDRDELGPLPINPFSSLRQVERLDVHAEKVCPGVDLTEMQKYLQELASGHPGGREETRDDGQLPNVDSSTSTAASDSRLEILDSVGNNGRWRDKLFRRVGREEKTVQLQEAMQEDDVLREKEDGVWC